MSLHSATCPHCGFSFRFRTASAGDIRKCKNCGQTYNLPTMVFDARAAAGLAGLASAAGSGLAGVALALSLCCLSPCFLGLMVTSHPTTQADAVAVVEVPQTTPRVVTRRAPAQAFIDFPRPRNPAPEPLPKTQPEPKPRPKPEPTEDELCEAEAVSWRKAEVKREAAEAAAARSAAEQAKKAETTARARLGVARALSDRDRATRILGEILEEYPDTETAKEAREQLRKWGR